MQARGSWRAAASWYDYQAQNSDNKLQTDTFRARQRARVWFDFIANDNLKAVLGLEIGDITWGQGAGQLGTDGKAVEVKHAYIDFNLPNTDINIKAGLQPIYIPGNLGSLVLDDDAAALMISTPINDMVSIAGGWIRAFAEEDGTQSTTGSFTYTDATGEHTVGYDLESSDTFDTLAVLVPVTADGFAVTPYVLYSMIGKNFYGGSDDATMWHAGFSAQVDILDPIVILADFIYGTADMEFGGNSFDESGYIFDLAVDYKMDFMTPEIFGWYVSGEDTDNDSSVMPVISPDVTATTFGFDGSKFGEPDVFGASLTDIPSWALGFKLKDMSFLEDLSHTFTFAYIKGTSDEGTWWFDEEDSAIEVDFDTKYQIYDELAAYLELGYISIDWDDTDAHAGSLENGYKCALGIKYDF